MLNKLVLVLLLCLSAICASAQTTEFTYQGKLLDGSLAPTANYDFAFRLFKNPAGGAQLGPTVKRLSQPVVNGIFTVSLDFGAEFDGGARYIEISVDVTGGTGATTLSPRQPITSAPYAMRSTDSNSADSLNCTSCVNNTQIVSLSGSKLTGTISGDGSGLTNLNGNNISTGSVTVNQLSPDLIDGPQRNQALLATLRWDLLKVQRNFAVASSPSSLAFDGTNIWVSNVGSNNVSKLRASDGNIQGTFTVGSQPLAVAFDGTNIWVVNISSNNVTKLRASDGSLQGTFAIGGQPRGVAFDGTNIWVASNSSNNVKKLRASDGVLLGTFATGSQPEGVTFDGVNIWVTNNGSSNVTKLKASDGALIGNFTVGNNPRGIAFDGSSIWVSNFLDGTVSKVRTSDGAVQGTYAVGTGPFGVAFDGTNIWVANSNSSNVTKLRASDGVSQGAFSTGTNPFGLAFDGSNMWVVNNGSDNVTRLFPAFPQ